MGSYQPYAKRTPNFERLFTPQIMSVCSETSATTVSKDSQQIIFRPKTKIGDFFFASLREKRGSFLFFNPLDACSGLWWARRYFKKPIWIFIIWRTLRWEQFKKEKGNGPGQTNRFRKLPTESALWGQSGIVIAAFCLLALYLSTLSTLSTLFM